MKRLTPHERMRWTQYHIPGTSNINRVKVNAVFLRSGNTLKHEMAKCRKAYDLIKKGHLILTEAQENKTGFIRDLVDLSEGTIYEFETNPKRAERFKGQDNVYVVKLWKQKKN